MSVISAGRLSSTPSILKRHGRDSLKIPAQHVKFNIDGSIKGLLQDFAIDKNKESYLDVICKIRDSGNHLTDEQFVQIINEAKECISILDKNLKLFVHVILMMKWVHRGNEAVQTSKNFILDLCSAHNYYTKLALQQLVAVFSEVIENSLHVDCLPSEQEEKGFQVAHEVIRNLLRIVPMSADVLLNIMKQKFPFRTEGVRKHLNYVHNLLIIASTEPILRRELFLLILSRLVTIDTICSKEEIEKAEFSNVENTEVFDMDVDGVLPETDMKHEDARKLDYCLHRLLKFIKTECHDKNGSLRWDKAKSLYQDCLYIFENILLSTFGCHHTQFVILYLISFSSKFTTDFLNTLWTKVTNPSVAAIVRETSIGYLVGVLSHASFISIGTIKTYLKTISNWLLQYIDNATINDEDETSTVIRKHCVFYATCQALFYLMNNRHTEFIGSEKALKFLENLNLGKIAMSRLKPLIVCAKPVVDNFINVTKTYQLVYCVSSSETRSPTTTKNFDQWMDGYFPFSMYLLRRSGDIITPIRRQVSILQVENREKSSIEEDEFIPAGSSHSPHVAMLGSSPFFSCAYGLTNC